MFRHTNRSSSWRQRAGIAFLFLCPLFMGGQRANGRNLPANGSGTPACANSMREQDEAAQQQYDYFRLQKVYEYAMRLDTLPEREDSCYAYTKFYLRIDRKNPTLMLVPSVYSIAHRDEREFVGESYNKLFRKAKQQIESENIANATTVPHKRSTFNVMLKYLTPKIYSETIIDNTIISPFHPSNHRFYKFRTSALPNGRVLLTITPKRKNTQLVIGTAIIDAQSGRVLSCDLTGEYDMTRFKMHIDMGKSDKAPPIPERCEVNVTFRFLRNKVSGTYMARYGLSRPIESSALSDYEKLCQVRPEPLGYEEQAAYDKLLEQTAANDSVTTDSTGNSASGKIQRFAKDVLWDMVGDNVFNRIKTHFGINNQGYIRLNPILNPLYMGYDHRRGFTYKMDLRASYQTSPNSEISVGFKAGYAFKQHQFFFRFPIYCYFNKRRNGYIKLEWNNGNHISNAWVRRNIEQQQPDSTLYDYDRLNEFKQTEVRAVFNYDLSDKWSVQLGSLFQMKRAVYKSDFEKFGWKKEYRSFAPLAEIQFRPLGWTGPVVTLDYDRGITGFAKANNAYERWEINANYLHQVNQLQSWRIRVGTGFYTMKGHKAYFLNYENFKENNLPEGWNDNTSCDFELLRSDTYNTSEYYIRANVTYESPLLVMSWLPWVGHYIEMERVYVSTLDVRNIHPYVEVGYGFTCRLMSLGFFASNGHGNRYFGMTFGLELFRHW